MPKTAALLTPVQTEVVAIVDDDPLISHGLSYMLEEHGWQVDAYDSAEAFLAAFQPGRANCLLLDINLPGISGLDLLEQLRRDGHRLPVTVMTGASDIKNAVAAMKAGATDFIEKPILGPDLIDMVGRSLDRGRDAGAVSTWRDAAATRIGTLTRRQREILALILAGKPNKIIALDLKISQRTVENHRARIMERTQSKSIPDLTRLALIADWSDGEPPAAVLAASLPAALSAALSAGPLDNEQLRRFFDAVPVAIIIAGMAVSEVILYANHAHEEVSGQSSAEVEGKSWNSLRGFDVLTPERLLGEEVGSATDLVGTFRLDRAGADSVTVDAYSSVIVGDDDQPAFRMLALVRVSDDKAADRGELEKQIQEKDAAILEIQHRVKNNLQIITSLIRIEARNYHNRTDKTMLGRLEGRINSIQILYKLLSDFSKKDEIDLGVYLSEIASSVMRSHAVEGIRLDLKVDAYPVSVNVALPTGLVANEVLTNALKYAFVGRDGGTITLHSLSDTQGCRVTIADDGVGLPSGVEWPTHGKIGELVARSLRQNAKADLTVESSPGKGTKVIIAFSRTAAAATSAG